MEEKNKIIIFDWGGVIESHRDGEYNIRIAVKNIVKRLSVDDIHDRDIIKEYENCSRDEQGTDIGCVNDIKKCEEWFERLKDKFHINKTFEDFSKVYKEEFSKVEYYQEVVEFAHSLKSIAITGILSNLIFLDKERLNKQVDFKYFDYVWLSFELNCEKPNEEIYEIVENDCKMKPENILFIDDCKENIEMAEKRGWNTCNAYGYELDKIKKSVTDFLK